MGRNDELRLLFLLSAPAEVRAFSRPFLTLGFSSSLFTSIDLSLRSVFAGIQRDFLSASSAFKAVDFIFELLLGLANDSNVSQLLLAVNCEYYDWLELLIIIQACLVTLNSPQCLICILS